jgi:hypothetical protein
MEIEFFNLIKVMVKTCNNVGITHKKVLKKKKEKKENIIDLLIYRI